LDAKKKKLLRGYPTEFFKMAEKLFEFFFGPKHY
jgi:hypothetical protein